MLKCSAKIDIVMKFFSISLFLLAAQLHSPYNGNLIPEPKLTDYSQGNRAPGIMGAPEEVQDSEGNPTSP
jgi:hypothetical protein